TQARCRRYTRHSRDDRSDNELPQPCARSHACQKSARVVGRIGCFPRPPTASESRLRPCLAADYRSSALVSPPTRHPDDLLLFCLVVSNHRFSMQTVAEVEVKSAC